MVRRQEIAKIWRRWTWAIAVLASFSSPVVAQVSEDAGNEFFSEALSLYQQGEYEGALERFDRGFEVDDSNASAHYYMAETLRKLGRLDQAGAHYQKVTQLGPNTVEASLAKEALNELRGGSGSPGTAYQACVAQTEKWHLSCIRKFDVSVVKEGYQRLCGNDHKALMSKCRQQYR